MYRKVASSNTSRLEAHADFFSCFCVGIFYAVAAKGLLLVVHTMYSLVAAADA